MAFIHVLLQQEHDVIRTGYLVLVHITNNSWLHAIDSRKCPIGGSNIILEG